MNATAGTYRARAVEAELGYASTGTEQVAVSFELLEGDAAGQRITWYGYFSDKGAARTIESLKHCGWDGNLEDLSTVGCQECQIVLDWEEFNGRESLRVKWVNGLGQGLAVKNRMDPAQRAAFAQRMKSTVAGVYGTAPASAARSAPRPNQQPQQRVTQSAQRPAATTSPAPDQQPDFSDKSDPRDELPF